MVSTSSNNAAWHVVTFHSGVKIPLSIPVKYGGSSLQRAIGSDRTRDLMHSGVKFTLQLSSGWKRNKEAH